MTPLDPPPTPAVAPEPASTLSTDEPRTLGTGAQLGLWGNLGISLLLPVAATFIVLPGQSLLTTLLAVVIGAAIGGLLLGASAGIGARTGAPAMVLLRGLLGARLSGVPTVLNLVQCVGWATFEIVVIAEVSARLTGGPRWVFVLLGGVLATAMALRPLGVVRLLARYAVWLAAASTLYLLVAVLREPLPGLTDGSTAGFWTSLDIVIALPASWVPLAADYARHSRSPRAAAVGAGLGYGVATAVFFTVGVLALTAYRVEPGFGVIAALLALPLAAVALLVLVVDELDEAFANLYSTAVSVQNLRPGWDRRPLVVGVGALSTALALTVDVYGYEPFLFLLGAVFVPLTGTLLVAWVLRRREWDTTAAAPARPELLLPWLAGFVAYQLTAPTLLTGWASGWTTAWTDLQTTLGVPTGWSASLVSLTVAAVLTAVLARVRR